MCLLHNCRGRSIRTSNDDCLRVGRHDLFQSCDDVRVVSGERSASSGRGIMLLQRELQAVEHGLAERIVLIDHADLVDLGVPEFVDCSRVSS